MKSMGFGVKSRCLGWGTIKGHSLEKDLHLESGNGEFDNAIKKFPSAHKPIRREI